jgi:Mg2+/Co2+ transporter CorB
LYNQLEIELPAGKYTTLAGYILVKTHSVPATGTVIREDGVTLTVTGRSAQAVLEVRIHLSSCCGVRQDARAFVAAITEK